MRRLGGVLLLMFAAAALLVASSGSAQREAQVISVLAVGERFQPIGVPGDRAPAVGDRFAFFGSFYAWAGSKRGTRIGGFEVLVTVTSPRWGYLTATGRLPGGLVFVAGRTPLFDVPVERHAVIGGTGRYAGARGTLTIRSIRGTDNSAAIFRLLP